MKGRSMYVHPKAHEYQRRALEFSLKNPESYQALPMGLGKTLIALSWIKSLNAPALVLAPLQPMYNTWPDEIAKWTPELKYVILHGPEKGKEIRKKVDVYLMNYDGIVWLNRELRAMYKQKIPIPFKIIVLDEGTMIKSHKTKRFQKLRALRPVFCKGKMILGAKPRPNSAKDLWSQYFFLDGGLRLGKAFTEFEAKYFYQAPFKKYAWEPFEGAEDKINARIADVTFTLKAEDHIKMPVLNNNFIKLAMPKKIHALYKELEEEFFIKLEEGIELEVFNKASLAMKLRQFVQGAVYTDKEGHYEHIHDTKIDALKELMEYVTKPVLGAIQFIFEMDMLRKAFPKVPVIRGNTSKDEARALIKDWNKGNIPLLLCHPKSLSHGVNLQTGSNLLLWYGLTWSYEQYDQLIGRLRRQGQPEETVVVHHFILRDTIDEAIMEAIKNKAWGQKQFLEYLYKYHRGEL
jgi:SNF2 family DNA or RNA helicase